jgi:hypothetical protein
MTDQTDLPDQTPGDTGEPVAQGSQSWGLILAALALIAIPVFGGYLLIQNNSAPEPGAAVGTNTGMGGAGSDAAPASALGSGVLPFADIQANEITIEPDPAGGGAVLRVNTVAEVACAVSYGLSPDLGSLATDTDMAGGGHTVHQPVMRGLTPGSTYFYSIQAIGGDGSLFQSEVMQFTFTGEGGAVVTADPAVQPPAPNVAFLAQVTGSSSEYSDAFAAGNAVDGDLATEWSSAGDGDDAFIVLQFADNMIVKGVGFRTREMTDGTAITLTFTVTVDGSKTYGPFEAGPGLAVVLAEFSGYELRFDVDSSTGGNTGAIEVEVYGEAEM